MKRIEFIAPVEAVRGNLSGRQDLRYAENNNKAFESPAGAINYARNYTPRYVGAKIAATGAKIFSVRTKNAVNMSPKAIRAMALLGGTGAIVGAILANKSAAPYANAYAQWLELKNLGNTDSFRKTLSGWVRKGLESKSATISFTGPRPVTTIANPWFNGTQTTGANISLTVLAQFWMQLAPDPIIFYVNGRKGIAYSEDSFSDVIGGGYNILVLSSETVGTTDYVKYNGEYLMQGDAYVTDSDTVDSNEKYTTTYTQPE